MSIVDGAEQDPTQCSFGPWAPMKVDENGNATKWLRRCSTCTNTEMSETDPSVDPAAVDADAVAYLADPDLNPQGDTAPNTDADTTVTPEAPTVI